MFLTGFTKKLNYDSNKKRNNKIKDEKENP